MKMALFSYLVALVILSVTGNAFVIISLLCNKKTRTTFDAFIINIFLMDFLIGGFLKSSFVIEDYFDGKQITDTHCYFMTTLMTASPTMVLMILIILSYYAIFASIKRSRIEKFLSPESSFVLIFILWFLVIGMHLIIHKVFGEYGSACAVEDKILSVSVFSNLILINLLIMQLFVIFIIEAVKKAKDAINLRRPEAVYNNLSAEINNNDSVDTVNLDVPQRRLLYVHSILFILFWMPFFSIRALYEMDKKSHSFDLIVIQLISYIAAYFKSALTPVVTLFVYPESRYLIRKIKEVDYGRWKCQAMELFRTN